MNEVRTRTHTLLSSDALQTRATGWGALRELGVGVGVRGRGGVGGVGVDDNGTIGVLGECGNRFSREHNSRFPGGHSVSHSLCAAVAAASLA